MEVSHKMSVKGAGNQQPKMPATDLLISFKLVASSPGSNASHFERKNGNCLIYRHKMTLNDAIQCRPIKMETLDGRRLLIPLDQIPSPGSVKVIEGEGMVTRDDTVVSTIEPREDRGDLYILFDIAFPKRLPGGPQQREAIINALNPCESN